jgi:hypothetical protein
MKHYQWFIALLLSLFLLGCASSENYAMAVNSWHGANVNTLINAWGFPSQVLQLANGNQLYVYQLEDGRHDALPEQKSVSDSQKIIKMPAVFSSNTFYQLKCTTWFEVDRRGRVVDANFRGSNCITSNSSINKYMNPRLRSSSSLSHLR